MKKLVLVESPSKAKTIKKYLGKEYTVEATMGHIIDLPSKGLNVDVENNYTPNFVVMDSKKKVLTKIRKALKSVKGSGNKENAAYVYLAMDPDREGEAIAYHVAQALKLKNTDYNRISFHEITKEAVEKAIKKPGDIDDNLVQAQFARRILDRLVGYKLSALIWTKMWYGLSAGRVQSPALRMVVEREEEIRAFVPDEYWLLEAYLLQKAGDKQVKTLLVDNKEEWENEKEPSGSIKFLLDKISGKKAKVESQKDSEKISDSIADKPFKVTDIVEKVINKGAYPPFTTSTLQQAGNNVFGFTAKRSMDAAQRLYQAGLITYMRTDSVNLSKKAIESARSYIESKYGADYLPPKPNYYKNKARISQEAHEAIRPTDISSKSVSGAKLRDDDKKLYDLIWKRTVASQMTAKKIGSLSIIALVDSDKKYQFKANSSKVIFDGWSRLFTQVDDSDKELELPFEVKKGDELTAQEIRLIQKFTQPKARYTEASLIKALEKYGIGRPSTYSSIINTILSRKYVEKEGRALKPTDIGELVCNFLKKYFNDLVDYDYTAGVEESLDEIALGKQEMVPFIDSQYGPMMKKVENVKKNVEKNDVVVISKSSEKCPKCSAAMVVKVGRYGKFYSCEKFPDCDGLKPYEEEGSIKDGGKASQSELLEKYTDKKKYLVPSKCDKCGGKMVLKSGRYGAFWACDAYPKCKNIVSITLKEKCPECGSNLVERKGKWGKSFIGCSGYPKCKYIVKTAKKSAKANSQKKSKAKTKKK